MLHRGLGVRHVAIGDIMKLCLDRRGIYKNQQAVSETRDMAAAYSVLADACGGRRLDRGGGFHLVSLGPGGLEIFLHLGFEVLALRAEDRLHARFAEHVVILRRDHPAGPA